MDFHFGLWPCLDFIFLLKNENQAAVERPVFWVRKFSSPENMDFDKGYWLRSRGKFLVNLQVFIFLKTAPIFLKFMCSIYIDDLSQILIQLRNLHLASIIKISNNQIPSKIITKSTTNSLGLFWSFRFSTKVSFHLQSLSNTVCANKDWLNLIITAPNCNPSRTFFQNLQSTSSHKEISYFK